MISLWSKIPAGRVLWAALLVAGLAVAAIVWNQDTGNTTVKARFTSAEGLYAGDDVKVLGVRVGEITGVENDGEAVLVTMRVDADQAIPADATAAIVSPSLVSGRFVQLDPVYTGGDRLEDGASIDVERTAVPVAFDDVKQQLTELATVLGPDKGEPVGPLATAITSLEKNLKDGNSTQLRSAITGLRAAATALADGRSDLFGTIEHLSTFTRNLALNDGAVRGFTNELDAVSGVLSANRIILKDAIRRLQRVLQTADEYFKKHRGSLREATADVSSLSATLADRSNELAGILHVAPHSLIGLHNIVQDQAITGRATLSALDDVPQLLCGAIIGIGSTSDHCAEALLPLLHLLGLTSVGDISDLSIGGRGQ